MQTLRSYLRKNMMAMLNQILRLLKKPKVLWSIVSVPSSVVGLVCYALSSSFNQLLGNWSWWKMLLYIAISFIICLAVLFSTARSGSTSSGVEANLAFMVLMITSFYSFFCDNVLKGKPDAYSLISSASFATMSLGLSKLTQFGYEIDLLYFFCTTLIVQLMKIKLWLVIVGGVFSYALNCLRMGQIEREEEEDLEMGRPETARASREDKEMRAKANDWRKWKKIPGRSNHFLALPSVEETILNSTF